MKKNEIRKEKKEILKICVISWAGWTKKLNRNPFTKEDWIDEGPSLPIELKRLNDNTLHFVIDLYSTRLIKTEYQIIRCDIDSLIDLLRGRWMVKEEEIGSINIRDFKNGIKESGEMIMRWVKSFKNKEDFDIDMVLWNNISNASTIFSYSKEIKSCMKGGKKLSRILQNSYHMDTKMNEKIIEGYLNIMNKKSNNENFSEIINNIKNKDEKIIKLIEVYFSENCYSCEDDYVDYIKGNFNLVVLVPHDGNISPSEVKERTSGVKTRDKYTKNIAAEMLYYFVKLFLRKGEGEIRVPHIVVMNMSRTRVDANRRLSKAVEEEDEIATRVWYHWHNLVHVSKFFSLKKFNSCQVIDIHGNIANEEVQIGYLLKRGCICSGPKRIMKEVGESSMKYLSIKKYERNQEMVLDLLCGKNSFSFFMSQNGVNTQPFNLNKTLKKGERYCDFGAKYFNGGFNTYLHHNSIAVCNVNAFQIEIPKDHRHMEEERTKFCESLSKSILSFINFHYGS